MTCHHKKLLEIKWINNYFVFIGTTLIIVQVNELSQCKEFADICLRVTEKRVLNTLNKDKNRTTIRYFSEIQVIIIIIAVCV